MLNCSYNLQILLCKSYINSMKRIKRQKKEKIENNFEGCAIMLQESHLRTDACRILTHNICEGKILEFKVFLYFWNVSIKFS